MPNQSIANQSRVRLDPDERRERILAAALKVFSEKGFTEASNSEIAREAGLNSAGLLTYYFPKKIDLLFGVIGRFSPPFQLIERGDELMEQEPRVVLRLFVNAYAELFGRPERTAFMKVLVGEAMRSPEVAKQVSEFGPERIIGFLTGYMAAQMRLGRLRKGNPELAARCLLGPLFSIAMQNVILGNPIPEAHALNDLADELLRNFFEGFEL